jgi:hypothetical protein
MRDDRSRVRKEDSSSWEGEGRCDDLRTKQGKGSHGPLYYGGRKTTVKDRQKEVGPGLLAAMLAQLGSTKRDLI